MTVGPVLARLRRFIDDEFVLPTAYRIYLVGAGGAIFVAALALIAALIFQTTAWMPVASVDDVPQVSREYVPMNTATAEARLLPPTNIRISVDRISDPQSLKITSFGSVYADTPNGIAKDGFEIVGGQDAALFWIWSKSSGGSPAYLRAYNEAIVEMDAALKKGEHVSRDYVLSVVATDKNGEKSDPVELTFSFPLGPQNIEENSGSAGDETQPATLSDWQEFARDVALQLDPKRTPQYFKIYGQLNTFPAYCGAQNEIDPFTRETKRAFESVKEKINLKTFGSFFDGICDAYQQAKNQEQKNLSQAVAERNKAIEHSLVRQGIDLARKVAAEFAVGTALSVVYWAVGMFLSLSLLLAFLSIERQSRAMRKSLDLLIAQRKSAGEGAREEKA